MSAQDNLSQPQFKLKYLTMNKDSTGYEEAEKTVKGPFYHGGRANVRPGDALTAGRKTNSWGDEGNKSSHIYFSSDQDTAVSYARSTRGHLYEVEPTGDVNYDANGGNESYKTKHPLKVVRKVPPKEWAE